MYRYFKVKNLFLELLAMFASSGLRKTSKNLQCRSTVTAWSPRTTTALRTWLPGLRSFTSAWTIETSSLSWPRTVYGICCRLSVSCSWWAIIWMVSRATIPICCPKSVRFGCEKSSRTWPSVEWHSRISRSITTRPLIWFATLWEMITSLCLIICAPTRHEVFAMISL